MKKGVLLGAILVLSLLLCACSLNPNSTPESPANEQGEVAPSIDDYINKIINRLNKIINRLDISKDKPVQIDDIEDDIKIIVGTLYDFSSDRAWITYRIDNEWYLGCVDKEGTILFAYPSSSINEKSEFINGAAYIATGSREEKTYWIINEAGDILTSSADSNFDSIVAYGGGYFLCYKDQSDFSGASNCYKVIDSTGKIVKEIIYAKEEFTHAEVPGNNLRYLGDGIFSFWKDKRNHSSIVDLYNIPDGIEFTCENIAANCKYHSKFSDGVAFFGRINLPDIILFKDGTYTELNYTTGLGNDVSYDSHASEGKVVLCEHDSSNKIKNMVYYSITDDNYYSLDIYIDNMYTKIPVEDFGQFTYEIVNDRFLVHLLGADNLSYIALIDTCNEIILEPVRCDKATEISCGRIVVRTEDGVTIYDTDGNIVFDMLGARMFLTGNFQDDVAILKGEGVEKYIDLQGNDLFDDYNFSNIVIREIPSN